MTKKTQTKNGLLEHETKPQHNEQFKIQRHKQHKYNTKIETQYNPNYKITFNKQLIHNRDWLNTILHIIVVNKITNKTKYKQQQVCLIY